MQSLEKGLTNTILNTDALTGLKQIPNNSIDCCITSPPYYALRKYGVPALWDNDPNCEHEWVHRLTKWHGDRGENEDRKEVFDDSFQIEGTHSDFCSKCNAWQGELGLEPTFQLYVEHLLQIFDEVKRVLKKEGSCWVVISDTYFGKPKSSTEGGLQNKSYGTRDSEHGYTNRGEIYKQTRHDFPDKSLCLIPERFAMGMIEHGWILRNKVIWHKRNCMPSSAKDRFTVDYENVYFFTKSQRYYFNTQYEPYQTHEDRPMGIYRANNWGYVSKYANTPYYGNGKKEYEENDVQNPSDVKRRILESMKKNMPPIGGIKQAGGQSTTYSGNTPEWKDGRIKRAVWTINTKPFSGASLLADYVGANGKPYKASPNCPIHAHLVSPQAPCKVLYDGQSTSQLNHNPDKSSGHVSTLSDEYDSKSLSSNYKQTSEDSLQQIPNNIPYNKNNHECATNASHTHSCASKTSDHTKSIDILSKQTADNLDSYFHIDSQTAISHNMENHKNTSRISQHDISCDKKPYDILDTQQEAAEISSLIDNKTDTAKCVCSIVTIDHFAVFPEKLLHTPIDATCPDNGICLDPFLGSGTTALVALKMNRRFIGIEPKKEYMEMAYKRIDKDLYQTKLFDF